MINFAVLLLVVAIGAVGIWATRNPVKRTSVDSHEKEKATKPDLKKSELRLLKWQIGKGWHY